MVTAAALLSAAWLGILTSISPCPLASNVAAVSYVSRSVGVPRRAVIAGIAYSLGRALTYVLVATLVVSSLLSIPTVSLFLQARMNQVLGPVLIVIGAGMLVWPRLSFLSFDPARGLREKTGPGGAAGAAALGILFALSFCPVSAGLFFGALIPLAVNVNSRVIVPAVYGIGTGLPVVVFAVLLVFAAHKVGRAFGVLQKVERIARPVTAAIFVIAGLYLSAIHLLGLELG